MRSIFLHIFVWTCFISSSALASVPTNQQYTRDSDIREGSLRLNCYFTYASNSSDIQADLSSNKKELEKLDAFINNILNDKQLAVKRIRLSGYSSIDGDYMVNQRLAYERAWSFREYLTNHYPSLHRYPTDVAWIPEDWEMLKNLLRSSKSRYKKELLHIITHVDSPESRKRQLKNLRNGAPYEWMKKELFPLMRRVEVIIDFETVHPDAVSSAEVDSLGRSEHFIDPLIYNVLDKKEGIKVPTRPFPGIYPWEERKSYSYTPRWAVRTNLLLWAGIMSDAKHTTFTPNISLEYYITDCWSIEAGMKYSHWHYDNDRRFHGLSGYRLEPRYWFKLPIQRLSAYGGVYGRLGEYNYSLTPALSKGEGEGTYNSPNITHLYSSSPLSFGEGRGEAVGSTGKYWDAGLSAGLYFHLTSHWGIEVGGRAGYVRTRSKQYTIEDGHRYLDGYQLYNKVRVTGLMLNLVYRWR